MIGIISAMQEEIQALLNQLKVKQSEVKGMRTYYTGTLFDKKVVLVFSRWGKVASATTATQLINDFELDEIIFSGVAGSIKKNIRIGDIIVGRKLIQHDMDASPILPVYEIPLLGKKYFETHEINRKLIQKAAQLFTNDFTKFVRLNDANQFNITKPDVYVEDIASGDQFISSKQQLSQIQNCLPEVACVEMEGASVAQVCYEYQIPFNIIRTISDNANTDSHSDFPLFAKHIASNYAMGILKKYFGLKLNIN
jgi:adenosylhomocysteine nucleosidase